MVKDSKAVRFFKKMALKVHYSEVRETQTQFTGVFSSTSPILLWGCRKNKFPNGFETHKWGGRGGQGERQHLDFGTCLLKASETELNYNRPCRLCVCVCVCETL
uniref:Uncharacterized protein n=1 Tax=Sphaerodactylus townsendi TaxID=933632 RepID=A0ACB8FJQ5_9SAUR